MDTDDLYSIRTPGFKKSFLATFSWLVRSHCKTSLWLTEATYLLQTNIGVEHIYIVSAKSELNLQQLKHFQNAGNRTSTLLHFLRVVGPIYILFHSFHVNNIVKGPWFIAWENSRRFARSPLEPLQNAQKFHTDDVHYPDLGSRALPLQTLVVLLIGCARRERIFFQPIRSTTKIWVVHVISMEFLRLLLRRRFARAQVATSRNVGCFLRLPDSEIF